MSKNKIPGDRAERRSYKEQVAAIASSNMKLTALLSAAKQDFDRIGLIASERSDNMKIIILPGQKKLAEDLDHILEITDRWKALQMVSKRAVDGSDVTPAAESKEAPAKLKLL